MVSTLFNIPSSVIRDNLKEMDPLKLFSLSLESLESSRDIKYYGPKNLLLDIRSDGEVGLFEITAKDGTFPIHILQKKSANTLETNTYSILEATVDIHFDSKFVSVFCDNLRIGMRVVLLHLKEIFGCRVGICKLENFWRDYKDVGDDLGSEELNLEGIEEPKIEKICANKVYSILPFKKPSRQGVKLESIKKLEDLLNYPNIQKSRFPLLQLPGLDLENVFKEMEVMDLISLSMTSKKLQRLISQTSASMDPIAHLEVYAYEKVSHVEIHTSNDVIKIHCLQKDPKSLKGIFDVEDYCINGTKVPTHIDSKFMTTFWRDHIQGMGIIVQYLMDLLDCKVQKLDIEYMEEEKKSLLVDVIADKQSEIEELIGSNDRRLRIKKSSAKACEDYCNQCWKCDAMNTWNASSDFSFF
ncbi:hypothetical protein L5515_002708 [Caenorhabditis briggsae]|uniref:F-box domain-containing protein n=1 Tax=Caenorhabditis briggsae TaxID=6238 RepID=A0AAE9E668_CAEBR|nr:hypothetical protein L5515_002708 [Caenorhabditis briggsae]